MRLQDQVLKISCNLNEHRGAVMKNQLDAIFSPESVAIIGASTTPGKVGHDIFLNILKGDYQGTLFPVNPKAKAVQSVKAYPSILDIPDPVDLSFIILPPKLALKAVQESLDKDVGGIVIVSAGFKEVGGEGAEIEQEIVRLCRQAHVRLVGPNCLGVINPVAHTRLNASFSRRMPQAGKISFISQSGALCTSVLDFAADRDFGFSKFISIGNKADVDEIDLLKYFHRDPDTEVIMIYLEELKRGQEFIDTVKEITSGERPKPVLVIKSGRTSAGAQAAASHTGAIAGSDTVYQAIFEQSGIIRAETINDLFDYATVFTYKSETPLGKLRRKVPTGNRVAIVTNAGGPGIVATDVTVTTGLSLARFSEQTLAALKKSLPPTANIHNPVDIIGDATQDRYENALRTVIADDNVDGALVIMTPQSMTDALGIAEAIVRVASISNKPIVCCFMGVVDVSPGVQYLQKHGYPVFKFPENAAKALGALHQFNKWLHREHHFLDLDLEHDTLTAKHIIADCLNKGQTALGELEGNEILSCYGFNTLDMDLATNKNEAVKIAQKIGLPVVLKIVSPQILHKSDAKGVKVGLKTTEEVSRAYEGIIKNAKEYDRQAEITGVLVEKMASTGKETILGVTRHPKFGPLVMFGLGGIFVEVFQDVSFRLAPFNLGDAKRMVRSIKSYKLLTGYRGEEKADLQALEECLIRLSDLVTNHPEIKEMDINPLLVHAEGQGVTVADCRIILEPTSKDE